MLRTACLVLSAFVSTTILAADPNWQPVTTKLLKSEKTGYGGLCGVVVDRKTGNVIINLSDRGMYRSTDLGVTWKHVTTKPPKGRTESPGCFMIDPTGKTRDLVTAFVYGAPIAISTDGGRSFRYLAQRSSHIDWCAVDWTDSKRQFVLALKHEQRGLLIASNDGGKTFRDIGTNFISGWVFDGKTAVVAHEGTKDGNPATLQRTTDGGKSFRAVGKFLPTGFNSSRALPKWKDGKLYWLTRQGLIVTGDKGATWRTISKVKDGLSGPVFGKDANQMYLVSQRGILESTDAGATWSTPISAPKKLRGLRGLTWLDYDPKHDVLYLMKMTSDLYRLKRGK